MNDDLPTKSDIEKITTKSTWSATLYVVIIVLLNYHVLYSMQKDSCAIACKGTVGARRPINAYYGSTASTVPYSTTDSTVQ